MIEAAVEIHWPEDFPLPALEYSGNPAHAILTSGVNSGAIVRRLRFSGSPAEVSASWVFTPEQLEAFRIFFQSVLNNGAARFSIDLKYPYNTKLTVWVVRFVGGYKSSTEDGGNWQISGSLVLERLVEVSDVASIEGYDDFLVLPDSDEFVLVGDETLSVRTS